MLSDETPHRKVQEHFGYSVEIKNKKVLNKEGDVTATPVTL